MLPETGRQFLAALSVFRGGWTLEAAQAVYQSSEEAMLELLMLLRDSSLISVVDTEDGLRFTILETVREYAVEQLERSEEREAVLRRHRDYFLALAEEAEPHLTDAGQVAWLARLKAEYDNLCAALEWSIEEGREGEAKPRTGERERSEQSGIVEVALRFVGALGRFWWVRGYLSEGRMYIAKVLGLKGAGGLTPGRAKALNWKGLLANLQGDYAAAKALHEESLAISLELEDKEGIAHSLVNLGNVAHCQGDYTAAGTLYGQSLALFQELRDKQSIATSLYQLGNVALDRAENEAARALYAQSLAMRRELGDKRGSTWSLCNLGYVAHCQGDYSTAGAFYEEALAAFRELGDKRGIAWTLHNLGVVARLQGDNGAAGALYEQSLKIRGELGDKYGIVSSLEELACLAVAEEQPKRAGRLLGAAQALREAIRSPLSPNERVEYERTVTAAREALGEAAFQSALAEGEAMPLEQAIAYALAWESVEPPD